MSLLYRGIIFDKRGCYVILPVSPFGRFDSNDNTAEADEEIEVLEGPEVEIVGSCESSEDDEGFDLDMESNKSETETMESEEEHNAKRDFSKHVSHTNLATEPDNKYYEVEAIIAGPVKRKEHLFKLCYKVRWKGYGPEADTWQPLADLANVQDMIDDFRKSKAEKKGKRKQPKQLRESSSKPVTAENNSRSHTPVPATSNSDNDDDSQQYDPEYGTVKDKFWKDLELGRVDQYTDLFSGDMYSKIKGCQRTAHAEAVANIHKQQSHAKSSAILHPAKTPSPKTSTPKAAKLKSQQSSALHSTALNSTPSLSKTSDETVPGRGRKRANEPFRSKGYKSKRTSEPFSSKGYKCKRARRSHERKSGLSSPDVRSSVTSETVGIVTTTSPILTPPVLSTSTAPTFTTGTTGYTTITYSPKGSSLKSSSQTAYHSDGEETDCEKTQMTVSSETMLTITTETEILNTVDIRLIEKDMPTNEPCPRFSTGTVNGGASGSDSLAGSAFEASGATSSGSAPGPSGLNMDPMAKRSTLDTRSEASGSIERSHDEECLWGGACNRSDCRANRRRNMKNGKDQIKGGHAREDEECMSETEEAVPHSESCSSITSSDDPGNLRLDKIPPDEDGATSPHSKRSNLYSASPKTGSKTHASLKSSPVQGGKSQRTLSSYSSDSSFDEMLTSNVSLNRESIKNSFGRVDPLVHRLQMDSLVGSSSRPSGVPQEIDSTHVSRRNYEGSERPGLFSDNNSAFSFARQDSGFSGGSSTPGEQHSQFTLPSPAGSINLSSPGKENFRSSSSENISTGSSGSHERLANMMEVDQVDPHQDTMASAPSLYTQTRGFGDSQEIWSRKRGNDVSQPLEKIPSPNSRRDSDLDRRISTLTCDELEDLVEQGEDRFVAKDVGFVTNADLLQAVNLSKAEVVKRAIRQSCNTERRLDLEQPDGTGLTLLMRAVQKGSVAIVEMLLENGANVNAQQTNGITALMIAAEQNGVCLLALLLKHGANSSLYTVHSDQAETALMKAIKRQNREVVNLMLRVGVNIAAPTCSSSSALELAIERRNPQIEAIVRSHFQRLEQAFRSRVMATLEETAELMEPLFPLQCFPLRESQEFIVKFNSNIHPVAQGEGFLLFIAHTKINDKGVRCRFHGGCPIGSVTLNGVAQSPLTKEVNFVTSCHPIIPGCNTLVIHKLEDYTSKAKLVVQAFRAKLLPC